MLTRAPPSPPRLSPSLAALLSVALFVPFTTLALPQRPNQLYVVCKEIKTSRCILWMIKPEEIADVSFKVMEHENPQYSCGLSNMIPIGRHENLIKVTPLSEKDFSEVEFCKAITIMKFNKLSGRAHRIPRQTSPYFHRGRFRGQTQSQYLAIDHGTGKDEGKAEAHSDADSSRAIVSGSSGMGQAQSQTIYDPNCNECYGQSDLDVGSLRRRPIESHKDSNGGSSYSRPTQDGTPSRNGDIGSSQGTRSHPAGENFYNEHIPNIGKNYMPDRIGSPVGPNQGNQDIFPGGHTDLGSNLGRFPSELPGRMHQSNQGSYPGGHKSPESNLGGIYDGVPGGINQAKQGSYPGGHTVPIANLGGFQGNQDSYPSGHTVPGSNIGGMAGEINKGNPGGHGPNLEGMHSGTNQGSHPIGSTGTGSNIGQIPGVASQGSYPNGNGFNLGRMPGGINQGNQGSYPVGPSTGSSMGQIPGVENQGNYPNGHGFNHGGMPGRTDQVSYPGEYTGSSIPRIPGTAHQGNQGSYSDGHTVLGSNTAGIPSGVLEPKNQENAAGGNLNFNPNQDAGPGALYQYTPHGITGGLTPQQERSSNGPAGTNQNGLLNGNGPMKTNQSPFSNTNGVNWPFFTGSYPGANGATYFCCVIGPNNNPQYIGSGQMYGTDQTRPFQPPGLQYGSGVYPNNVVQPGGQYGIGPGGSNIPGSGVQPGGQYGTGSGGPNIPGGGVHPGAQLGFGPGGSNIPGGQYGTGSGGATPGGQYGAGPSGSNTPGGPGAAPGGSNISGGQYEIGPGGSNIPGRQSGTGPGGSNVPSGGLKPGGQYGTGPGVSTISGESQGYVPSGGLQPGGQYGIGSGGSNIPGQGLQPGGQYGGQYGTGPGLPPGGQYGTGQGESNVPGGGMQPSGLYGTGPSGPNVPGSGVLPGGQYGNGAGGSNILPGGGAQPGGQYGTRPSGSNIPGGVQPGGPNVPGSGVLPGGQYGNGASGSNIPGGVQPGGQYGTGHGESNVPGGGMQPSGLYGTGPIGSNIPGNGVLSGGQYGNGAGGSNILPGGGVQPGGQYGTGPTGSNIPGGVQPGGQYGTGPGGSNIPGGGVQPGGQYGTGSGGSNVPDKAVQPGGQYGTGPSGSNIPGGGVQLGGQYGRGPGGSNIMPGSGVQLGGQYGAGLGGSNIPGGGVQPGGQYGTGLGGSNVPGGGVQPGGQYGTGLGGPNVPGSGPGGQYGTGTNGPNVPGSVVQPGGQYGTGPDGSNIPGGGIQPGGQYGSGLDGSNIPGVGVHPGGQYGTGPEGSNIPGGNVQYGTGSGGNTGVPLNVIDPNSIASIDDYDSEAEANVAQTANGTTASATSRGGNEKGHAQTNVQGTYTGTGSFSAQADISDETKGAHSEVEGGKKGSKSSAQGRGRNNLSQATVHLGSETGSLQTVAESNGKMHSSNSKVQGSVKGGMADAQARGPGSTSSQAQIGFTPYKEGDKSHELLSTPFVGKGAASAQSSGRSGQSQSNLQGTFKYGITYNGAAQAGASIDKDAVFPNRLPFNSIDVFDEKDKNINVNTANPSDADTLTQKDPIEKTELETMNKSESRYSGHAHSDHHVPANPPQTPKVSSANVGSRRSFQTNYDTNGAEYEYTTGKDDAADDYYPDGSFGPEGSDTAEIDQGEYPNYEEYARDGESTHQSLHSQSKKGIEVKQTTGGNTQHIVLGSLTGQDAEITQKNSERPDENRIYQPGERVPGTGGYTIPIGFTGSVKSVASKDKTYVVGSKGSPSQAQTVSLSPGTGKVRYVYPTAYGKNVNSKNLKSLYNPKLDDSNRYVSVSKSVTRDLDGENNVRKQYSHTYYTKSSSCGYFTFTCTMVSGADGRKKVCKPKIPTNPDGTPMKC